MSLIQHSIWCMQHPTKAFLLPFPSLQVHSAYYLLIICGKDGERRKRTDRKRKTESGSLGFQHGFYRIVVCQCVEAMSISQTQEQRGKPRGKQDSGSSSQVQKEDRVWEETPTPGGLTTSTASLYIVMQNSQKGKKNGSTFTKRLLLGITVSYWNILSCLPDCTLASKRPFH